MLRKRQTAFLDRARDRRSEITTLARDYPHAHVIPFHFHDRDQIVYAWRGVMTVRTETGTWVVPPQRAVWIPTGIAHTIWMSGIVAMRTLYLKPRLAETLPRDCCVINVTALLRELILHACRLGTLKKGTKSKEHVIGMILDQFEVVEMIPLELPHLSDPRARRVADELARHPSDRRTLAKLCSRSGASKRTIERLFQDQAGMTFGKWRQQLRLMQAMRLLAEGTKVTHAALEAGYSTPSAFISMFRKTLGTTPTQYFKTVDSRSLRGER